MSEVLMVAPLGMVDIEIRAQQVLKGFCPEVLVNAQVFPIDRFLEKELEKRFGYRYCVNERMPPGVFAETNPLGRMVEFAPDTFETLQEHRHLFTGAHEIGHVDLHGDQVQARFNNNGDMTLFRRSKIKPFLDPEWQANAYAAALLMPIPIIQKIVHAGGGVSDVASLLKVSQEAAQFRLSKLREKGYINGYAS
jgi:hypothetical protein